MNIGRAGRGWVECWYSSVFLARNGCIEKILTECPSSKAPVSSTASAHPRPPQLAHRPSHHAQSSHRTSYVTENSSDVLCDKEFREKFELCARKEQSTARQRGIAAFKQLDNLDAARRRNPPGCSASFPVGWVRKGPAIIGHVWRIRSANRGVRSSRACHRGYFCIR